MRLKLRGAAHSNPTGSLNVSNRRAVACSEIAYSAALLISLRLSLNLSLSSPVRLRQMVSKAQSPSSCKSSITYCSSVTYRCSTSSDSITPHRSAMAPDVPSLTRGIFQSNEE